MKLVSCFAGAKRVLSAASVVLLAAALVIPAATAPAALANAAAPHWSIASESQPTYFSAAASSDAYVLVVRNDGGAPTAPGGTVTITDRLPEHVTATKVVAKGEAANGSGLPSYELKCTGETGAELVTCTYEEGPSHGRVLAGATIVVAITVSVPSELAASGVSSLVNTAVVSGGGTPSAVTSEVTPIAQQPAPFGLSSFLFDVVDESGAVDSQAGSHPFEMTTSLAFNVSSRESPSAQNGEEERPLADAAVKDIELSFPPGLVGDPNAVPQCSQQAFLEGQNLNCPVDTQVGTVKPFFYGGFPSAVYPVFNLTPPAGAPAELGFSVATVGRVTIFLHVRPNEHGEDRIVASLNGIPETGPLQGAMLTLWGLPAEASHDLEREGTVGAGGQQHSEFCKPSVKVEAGVEHSTQCSSDVPVKPFLTLPSRCQSEQPLTIAADSWESSAQLETFPPRELETTGCEQLAFTPSLALTPQTSQANTPSGYTVELHVPQNEDPTGLAEADLRDATVTLPAGIVVSPSSTNGLRACAPAQFALSSTTAASCPVQSQVGTVKITTPILSAPLEGQIFLGESECAPCTPADAEEGKLIRLQLQAQGSGVTVKLEGAASIDQATGELTVTFRESPQLPFEYLKLTLVGGPRAPLANASLCGVPLAASSSLVPYSSETPAQPSSEPYELSGCPASNLKPMFLAGTTNNQAGGFSPLTLVISRNEQDEALQSLSVRLPPGLLGMLSRVQPCPQTQARAGTCGPQSRIGSVSVGVGPGPEPAFMGGTVYLTESYEGAPFGLSIVVPAVAGPFDLGTIVVGARIEVDPRTAALTIASDPLPQRLDGIPLQLKTIELDIDRAGFAFNPTDCRPLTVEGIAEGAEGAMAPVSSRFQAANCATLPFKPRLGALAHAKTSKTGGAYLHMRLESKSGAANIAALKVDFPKQLPVRLTTLQRACAALTIEANPADCPAASVVGSVTAITPVLRHPLLGPVYLVSHGGASAPGIEIVLQGEGVTVDVIGQTSVKHGAISAIFRALPDVPVSTLGLVLGTGPHSLLAASLPTRARRSLCGQKLAMPVAITGQNGAVVKQTATIGVSGCGRHTTAKRIALRRQSVERVQPLR